MNKEEKKLFKSLCNFKAKDFDKTLLEYATPSVLGYLFFNRMQAVAYGVLKQYQVLGKVNREFRNSLRNSYDQNIEKNKSFFLCVEELTNILSKCNCPYAMLKGAFLCRYYPEGYRTSNDIDLLVYPEHVTIIGQALANAGFQQGNIRNEEFVPANRREIIESKMMRGETVPYIKKMDLPGMKFLEVDINFSLDYKNGDTKILEKLLNRVQIQEVSGLRISTLDFNDFFLHLCCHLYKEATTLPWVEMKRDMTLYKYCDIYMLLSEMNEDETKKLFERCRELGLDKICAFAILQTAALFDVSNIVAISRAKEILADDSKFVHIVVSPKEEKTFIYKEENIMGRFFSENRKELLKEVEKHAKTKNES